MTPDIEQAQRFLALLDSDSAPHEWHYRAICPNSRADLKDAGRSKNLASLDALLAKNIGGYGAYVVVNAGGHDAASITGTARRRSPKSPELVIAVFQISTNFFCSLKTRLSYAVSTTYRKYCHLVCT